MVEEKNMEQKNAEEKNLLMDCFLIISVLVLIYIVLLSCNVDKIVGSSFTGDGESVPPVEHVNIMLKYAYPALFVYIVSFVFFIKKKIGPKKIMYPIATFTFVVLWHAFGYFTSGSVFTWMLFISFLPSILLIVISEVLGGKMDKKGKGMSTME